MSPNTKPFEIRARLLDQAESILNRRYHSEYDKIRLLLDKNLIDPKNVIWPVPPSTDDVLVEAEKLYKFIQMLAYQ